MAAFLRTLAFLVIVVASLFGLVFLDAAYHKDTPPVAQPVALATAAAVAPRKGSQPTAPATAVAKHVTLSGTQQSEIEQAIKRRLKDPESARFADISAFYDGKQTWVCGTVNAKNSFGGYNGPSPFWGSFSGHVFEFGSLASNATERFQVNNVCTIFGIRP